MVYEVKTIKVELNGSKDFGPFRKADYAVFYEELLHGTQKAVNALTRRFLKYPEGQAPTLTVEGEDGLKVKGPTSVDVDLAAVDWDEVNDIILIGQVKEWSFGPVNQATLDGLPENIREGLVNEANKIYGKRSPLPQGGGGN